MTGGLCSRRLVVAASGDGQVWAVDRRSGELRWTLGSQGRAGQHCSSERAGLSCARGRRLDDRGGVHHRIRGGLRLRRPRESGGLLAGGSGPLHSRWRRRTASPLFRTCRGSWWLSTPRPGIFVGGPTIGNKGSSGHRPGRATCRWPVPDRACGLCGPTEESQNSWRSCMLAVAVSASACSSPTSPTTITGPGASRPTTRWEGTLTRAGSSATITMTVEDQGSPTSQSSSVRVVHGHLPDGRHTAVSLPAADRPGTNGTARSSLSRVVHARYR